MGGVSDSVNLARVSPVASLPSVSSLIDLLQPHATAGWAVPEHPVRDQPAPAADPMPGQLPGQMTGQAQLLTLALVLNQAPPQTLMGAAARPSASNPASNGIRISKGNSRIAKQAAATREFQFARKLYSGETDDASPQISIIG